MAEKEANKEERKKFWYLDLMAPNTKGANFAWLDPSTIYANGEAFDELVNDLVLPFCNDPIDFVVGIDAMGFILGAAIAQRLKKGFVVFRKAGHLCVDTDSTEYKDYSQRTKVMEVRKMPFRESSRILLVDQWIETGGTMDAAITLVERHGGTVAGIAAICIEENTELARNIRQKYKCSTTVQPGSVVQEQCNKQYLKSFKNFPKTSKTE